MAILTCSCKSEFQDDQYGRGKRVFNSCGTKGSGGNRFRCTVCQAEQSIEKQKDVKLG